MWATCSAPTSEQTDAIESSLSDAGGRARHRVHDNDQCGSACGTHAEVTDTVATEARCDAEVVDLREGNTRGHHHPRDPAGHPPGGC